MFKLNKKDTDKIQKLQNELKANRKKQMDLSKKMRELGSLCSRLRKSINKIKEKDITVHDLTPKMIMQFDVSDRDSSISGKLHDIVDMWFWHEYNKRGLKYGSGYHTLKSGRGMASVEIKMTRAIPWQQQDGIKDFIPYLPKNENVHIFESNCGSTGLYSLDIKNLKLFCNRIKIAEFDNLDEALEFIHKNHYYD